MMCWVCAVVLVLLRSCRILTINGFTISQIISQIYVEYVLNWFNDYIPLASTWLILTHFESSSHGFTLYIVILQSWNERIPFATHLMVANPRPEMSLRQRGKSEATKARFGLTCFFSNFPKISKNKNFREQVVNLSTIWRLNLWLSLIAPFSRLQCLSCQLRPYSLIQIIQLEFRRCR